jgi:uncharacterized DUF497 family protein
MFIDSQNKYNYIYSMIEWDDNKRNKTLRVRGLDFADVATVDWEEALTIEDVRQPYPETRYVTYAPLRGRMCVFVWCYRGKNIRVISLRKANDREVKKYEGS